MWERALQTTSWNSSFLKCCYMYYCLFSSTCIWDFSLLNSHFHSVIFSKVHKRKGSLLISCLRPILALILYIYQKEPQTSLCQQTGNCSNFMTMLSRMHILGLSNKVPLTISFIDSIPGQAGLHFNMLNPSSSQICLLLLNN